VQITSLKERTWWRRMLRTCRSMERRERERECEIEGKKMKDYKIRRRRLKRERLKSKIISKRREMDNMKITAVRL
jgi:hypothetical protein